MAGRQISATTYLTQDIRTGITVATYTVDADRTLYAKVYLSGCAGGGDYLIYLTQRRLGAGLTYPVVPKTTYTAAAAEAAYAFQTVAVQAKATDVLGVYVDGLVADSSVTVIIEWWEDNYLSPAVTDRTIDVSAAGAVTATGVGTPVALDGGLPTLAGMLTKIADDAGGGAFDATTDSLHEIATDIAGAAVFPAGAIEFTYTVTDSTTLLPVDSVDVWISTDAANPPTNVIWRGTTDVFGIARDALARKPWLDPGTYYFWLQDEAYSVVNPDTEVVS